MLRYQIQATDIATDNIATPVEVYQTKNLMGAYFNKRLAYFIVPENEQIAKGNGIMVSHNIMVSNALIRNVKEIDKEGNAVYYDPINDYDEFVKARAKDNSISATDSLSKFVFSENLIILEATKDAEDIKDKMGLKEIEEGNMMFTALTERFFKLTATNIAYISDNAIYVAFKHCHFYSPTDDDVTLWLHMIFYTDIDDEGKLINEGDINIKVQCKYVNTHTLKLDSKEVNKQIYLKIDAICDNGGNDILSQMSVGNKKIYEQKLNEYIKGTLNSNSWRSITYMRESPFYVVKSNGAKLDRFLLYTFNPKKNITIGLSHSDNINMLQSNLIEQYVEKVKEESINDITEMEKDVYHPVILKTEFSNGIPSEVSYDSVEDVNEILFNLHFREHKGDDWLVEPTDGWNNLETTGSDTLDKLNFNITDVKYRKNRLKKSFIRLSFYDSMNAANQNMLASSTIFIDSGKLFIEYLNYDKGISELDCQFSVMERDTTDSSSEGFYLYLWKDNDGGVVPSDIYMRVEFNHAGYGRTIPFILPYWDKNLTKNNKIGIKTPKEISDDWENKNSNYYTNGRDTRYTVKDYIKYSYIHFKYRYDKENERHIYYLDDTVYGDSVYFTDNNITLDLYEARII